MFVFLSNDSKTAPAKFYCSRESVATRRFVCTSRIRWTNYSCSISPKANVRFEIFYIDYLWNVRGFEYVTAAHLSICGILESRDFSVDEWLQCSISQNHLAVIDGGYITPPVTTHHPAPAEWRSISRLLGIISCLYTRRLISSRNHNGAALQPCISQNDQFTERDNFRI